MPEISRDELKFFSEKKDGESKKRKFLVVHGYPLNKDSSLGDYTESVCQKVKEVQTKYTDIVLLGGYGWEVGYEPLNVDTTVAEAMKQRLIELGVPAANLHADFGNYIPARTTAEEIDLIPKILTQLGVTDLKNTKYDVVAIGSHRSRITILDDQRRYYSENKGPLRGKFISADIRSDFRRKITDAIGTVASLADPHGHGPLEQHMRRIRTPKNLDSKLEEATSETWK